MKYTKKTVFNIIPNVVPSCLECLVVDVSGGVVSCKCRTLVVAHNRRCKLRTDVREILVFSFSFTFGRNDTSNVRNDKADFQKQPTKPNAFVCSK